MSSTLHRIDGVTLASGKPAYGSREMAAWLPTFITYMRQKHGVTLTTIKVADLSPTAASAATHTRGYAVDFRTWNLTAARQRALIHQSTRLGMPGHLRIRSQGFDPHAHHMLDVGYTTPCSYQIARTRNGRDGLARNGPDLDRAHRPAQPWPRWDVGLALMLRELNPEPAPLPTPTPPATDPVPRVSTPGPWMTIPVDGILGGVTISRLQWEMRVHPTGRITGDHWTVRALKIWLGGGLHADDGTGTLRTIDVHRLQSRVEVTQDGRWGPVTTRALQAWLNINNPYPVK